MTDQNDDAENHPMVTQNESTLPDGSWLKGLLERSAENKDAAAEATYGLNRARATVSHTGNTLRDLELQYHELGIIRTAAANRARRAVEEVKDIDAARDDIRVAIDRIHARIQSK